MKIAPTTSVTPVRAIAGVRALSPSAASCSSAFAVSTGCSTAWATSCALCCTVFMQPSYPLRRRVKPLLPVVLDDVLVADLRPVGIAAHAAQRSALVQQIPALVERDLDLLEPALVLVEVAARLLVLPEAVLLGDELFDRLVNLAVVHAPTLARLQHDVGCHGVRFGRAPARPAREGRLLVRLVDIGVISHREL